MQPAHIFNMEMTATSFGDDGCNQESEMEEKKERTDVMNACPTVPVGLNNTQPGTFETDRSKPPSNTALDRKKKKKKSKRKLQLVDTSASLMSELPFALASPATWKELGFNSSESTQGKRKRRRDDTAGQVDSGEDVEKKKKKKKDNHRPNYFVSIPITDTQIRSGVMEVQEALLEKEPRLAKAMIPVPTLHITLLVAHLANQEQVDLAVTALAQAKPSLAELLGGRDLVLSFSGISHFRREVVFVELAPGQHRDTLQKLADLLRRHFEDHGLPQSDARGFAPHLTVMKLSKARKLHSQGIKRVDPALFSEYTNKLFGEERVGRVDLCSMLKKKQKDGYYYTESSLQLDLVQISHHAKRTSGRRQSEPDEAELLRVSKRLVDDAVNRALQQYKQETLQNGGGLNATEMQPPEHTLDAQSPGATTKLAVRANSTTDTKK